MGDNKESKIDKNATQENLNNAHAHIESLDRESKARENFVSALSHDLRNPLSAARMSAQLIAKKLDNKEHIQKHVDRIIANIDRADTMIRNLLDANRIKSGEPIPLHIKLCNLSELIKNLALNLSANEEKLHFMGKEQVFAEIDPEGVQRIIENLITNALKYGSPESEVHVYAEEFNDEVSISVHNLGNPIQPADLENIFDQFKRSPNAQKSITGGWGIGLTLVKGLAEAHGGNVRVSSNREHGTTFTVSLPKKQKKNLH